MSYLAKRGSMYYFRRVVPDDLRPVLAKAEIMKSLRTKDREEAKRLIPLEIIQSDALFAEARKSLATPAPKPAAQIERERRRWEYEQEQAEFVSDAIFAADMELAELGPVMDALSAGIEPDAPMADIAKAGLLLARDAKEEIAIARLQGEAQARAMLEKGRASESQNQAVEYQGNPGAAKRFSLFLDTDILDGWAAERKPEQKTKDAYGATAALFNSLMGRKSATLITKADCLAFKQKLLDDGRSQYNAWDKLGKLRTLLEWAAQNDKISENPARDVRMRVTERGDKREDWTVAELNRLLAGPVHAKREIPKTAMAGGEAAYWLPLLAIFSGARREELGQLLVSDVRLEHYYDDCSKQHEAWFINITDNEDAGNRVKNYSSRRLVPLHPKLIELGFVSYVQSLPDKQGQIFPLLKRTGAGLKLTDKFGQWFTTYRRSLGISDKKVFHGFRHTWKTQAVDAGIAERVCRQFQGHEGKDVADKYGGAPSLRTLVEAISTYRIPGLEVPNP